MKFTIFLKGYQKPDNVMYLQMKKVSKSGVGYRPFYRYSLNS